MSVATPDLAILPGGNKIAVQEPQANTYLAAVRQDIERHVGVNHLFLNRIATSPFSREDYRIFAENHYPLVCLFTSYLERLLIRAPDSEAKLWLAKVLVDEYGEGSRGEDHATLYGQFMAAAGSNMITIRTTDKGVEVINNADYRVPRAALAFITEHRRIVNEEPFLVGLGAVGPGHEWSIPKMFDALIPGLRGAGFGDDEIEYFLLHCEQDIDLGTWLAVALGRYTGTEEARQQIRRGAMLSLTARARFWTGVQNAIVKFRQPRAPRPDTTEPRSLLHEIALSAWDATGFMRRLEDEVQRRRDLTLPTVDELIMSVKA